MIEPTYVPMALLVKVYSMTFLFVAKKSTFMFTVAVGLTAEGGTARSFEKDYSKGSYCFQT